ncbi:hypothetical protein [Phenylobacterium sp.]|uniref:hypothetical protein n=1 Tax=Phenylobacterium sp. TaxID=1871053 RepID=UPI0025D3D65F|nr:hypothetical protein [Phenylobacterium sp.]
MDRSLKLLIAAAAAIAIPLPAAAQAWPATVVASAPQLTGQKRLPLTLDAAGVARRGPAQASRSAARPALKLTPPQDLGEIPEVRIQAKDDWFDDQGFRVSPTKLAFKRRF